MAIVVPKALPVGDCYMFVGRMEAPFTAYASDLACVRPPHDGMASARE